MKGLTGHYVFGIVLFFVFEITIGGYKGLYLSGIFKDEVSGAIYIDRKKHLPHGLVILQFERE